MTMKFDDSDDAAERGVSPLTALYSILGFWFFYMVVVTLRAGVMGFESQDVMAMRRGVVTVFGIVITWLLYLLLRRFDRSSLTTRISVAFVAAIPGAIAIAAANYYIFNVYDPDSLFIDHRDMSEVHPDKVWMEIAEVAIGRYFFLSAWAALYLAFSYAADVRRFERRAARYEQAAQQSELRSLRYQVNPHFLFNTLNSLSSLVMTNRQDEAEKMIMSLSNFYRTSLTGDPLDDVELTEEVHLQKLYLDIEAVRFPERLRTHIDIPPHLMSCCVPGLILQPLVENAIKYGVSRATRPVTVTISAREEGDTLHLTVSDDGDVIAGDQDKGNGIGLANVRERLAARFGDKASLNWRKPESGGFIVDLKMPVVRHGC